MNMVKVKKEDLAKLLKQRTEEFLKYGGEVVRYASPSNPNPIKTGAKPILPTGNLREDEWKQFIADLEAGTYVHPADLYYKDPDPQRRRLLDLIWKQRKGRLSKDDFRGFKTLKGHGPKWK